jgi:hypothetical protein
MEDENCYELIWSRQWFMNELFSESKIYWILPFESLIEIESGWQEANAQRNSERVMKTAHLSLIENVADLRRVRKD